MHRSILVAAAAFIAAPAHAEWSGKGEAGLVFASGNTETETANAKLKLVNEINAWKHELGASGLFASDEDGTTANRWETGLQSNYNFGPKTFWLGALRYERDQFSGFEYQAIGSTGLGRTLIDTPDTRFDASMGVGYKFFETRAAFDELGTLLVPAESDSETVFRSTLDFEHKLTGTTSVLDKLIVESGADNTFVQNDLSVQVQMTDVLALAVGYSVRSNSRPPTGFKKTDTLTTLSLVYEVR
jgi:putative salt-induced outer membrane protein